MLSWWPKREPDDIWRELQRSQSVGRARSTVEGLLREMQKRDELQRDLIDALRRENDDLREKCGQKRRNWNTWSSSESPAGFQVRGPSEAPRPAHAAGDSEPLQSSAASTLPCNPPPNASAAPAPAPPPRARRVVRVAYDVRGTLVFSGGNVVRCLLDAAKAILASRGVDLEFSGSASEPAPQAAMLFWREESRGAPDQVLAALSELAPAAPRRAVVFMHRAQLEPGEPRPRAMRHEAFVADRLRPAAAALLDGVFDDTVENVAEVALAAQQNAALVGALADFLAASAS
eukprot:tig00020961_g16693.t1